MNDGLLSKCVEHGANAPLPNLRLMLKPQQTIHEVGWAKRQRAQQSRAASVGHGAIAPLPNLRLMLKPQRTIHQVGWAKRQRAQHNRTSACWARRYRTFAQPTTDAQATTDHLSSRLGKAPACPTTPHPSGRQNLQGFSLLEMIVVVLILSIIARVAIPNLSPTDPIKLDTAAKQVAEAIRFARAEAIRTKIPRGIFTDATNERIRVYSLSGLMPVYDIYHPIDKKLYDIQLKTDAFVAGVDLVSVSFAFAGGFSSPNYLGFNTEGNPKYSVFLGNDYMLISGAITLSYQGQQRIVSIAPVTGRVTIQ